MAFVGTMGSTRSPETVNSTISSKPRRNTIAKIFDFPEDSQLTYKYLDLQHTTTDHSL